MSNTAWWYVARSSGLVAWLFLVATVVIGTLAAGRMVARKGATRWLSDLHPWLAALSVMLTALHIGAIVADHSISFGVVDVFVPFVSSWRPGAIAWGTSGTAERGHHVVDGRSGAPAVALSSVTVVAADLTTADVDATIALALGLDAPGWLRALDGCEAYVIDAAGYEWATAAFPFAAASSQAASAASAARASSHIG